LRPWPTAAGSGIASTGASAAFVNSATKGAAIATAAQTTRGERQVRAESIADRLYSAHRSRLLAIARRNCADAEDAEEALHDAFVLFIDHYDPDGGAPAIAWLTLTLKRRCWALSSRPRLAHPHVTAPNPTGAIDVPAQTLVDSARRPDELAEVNERVARMRSHFARLKPNEREALCLLALGYSYSEICEVTGWTYTKVNRCLVEGRAQLRKLDEED
jgi:RNA polymerase sigma factor (sigma-70 family)